MDKQDQTLDCVDCKLPFTFTAGEQDFFAERGLASPKRCKSCREAKRKAKLMGAVPGEQHEYKCADCNADTTLNFKTDRPVWCKDCFPKHRK